MPYANREAGSGDAGAASDLKEFLVMGITISI
jgi:hypothetical protein